jgi:cytochrome c oxidase subunit 4
MENSEAPHAAASYSTYILVWLGLLVFTSLTVAVAGFHLGSISIFAVILIAACKSSLVLSFFMHLRYEKPLFRILVLVALATLAVFIALTFADISYR